MIKIIKIKANFNKITSKIQYPRIIFLISYMPVYESIIKIRLKNANYLTFRQIMILKIVHFSINGYN
jgi:hypothetical protein